MRVAEVGTGGVKSRWCSTGYTSAPSGTGETLSVGIAEAREQGLFACRDAHELPGTTEGMEGEFELETLSRPLPKAPGLA
jgi:hypothetical protein